MKRTIIFSAAFLMGLVFTSFSSQVMAQTSTKKLAAEQQVAIKYTCTMHPEVVMDKPGKCPKCGMTLVEKKEVKKDGMKKDSTMMKHDHKKMVKDSTTMKKGQMKHDHMDM